MLLYGTVWYKKVSNFRRDILEENFVFKNIIWFSHFLWNNIKIWATPTTFYIHKYFERLTFFKSHLTLKQTKTCPAYYCKQNMHYYLRTIAKIRVVIDFFTLKIIFCSKSNNGFLLEINKLFWWSSILVAYCVCTLHALHYVYLYHC